MLRDRAVSAAILIPTLLIVLAVGEPLIAIVVGLVVGLAAFETYRLLRMAGYPSLSLLGVVIAVAVALGTTALSAFADVAWLLVSLGIILAAVGSFPRPDPRDGLATWVTTIFGAVYVALLGFVVRLGQEAPGVVAAAPLSPIGAERGWILLLVLAVWAYDTGAYVVGRRLGKTRFLTHISPSKTHAGLVGGLVATTAVASAMLWGLGQAPAMGLVVGPLVGLAAQAGDLAESMLKRAAGAKDSSNLIPGHGGVLDRIDSFLFAAPALVLYVVATVR